MTQEVVINGYRTRKEVAQIVGLSIRSFYSLLSSEPFATNIPKRGRLSPQHQRLIFDHCGIPYAYLYINV